MKSRALSRKVTPLRLLLGFLTNFPKMLRLTAFLLVVSLGAGAFLMHRARAQLSESFMTMGAEMMAYEFANPQSPPQKMTVNGQTFWLNTGNTDRSVDEVLDWFEQRCMAYDGQMAAQMEEALARADEPLEVDARLLDATLRESEPGSRGFVSCLATGTERLGLDDLVPRIQRFMKTLRISDIGDLRYVYVKKGRRKTIFITLWTEGVLDLGEMFAVAGDVPGGDVADVPRPRQSRRILSVTPEGHHESVTMYESHEPRHAVEAYYKEQLPLRGWSRIALSAESAKQLPFKQAPSSDDLLLFEWHERQVVVVVNDQGTGGKTVTAVLTL